MPEIYTSQETLVEQAGGFGLERPAENRAGGRKKLLLLPLLAR